MPKLAQFSVLNEPIICYNRLMTYNWELPDWPNFKYDASGLDDILLSFSEKSGRVRGIVEALPENIQNETILDLMVSEAIKTSEIEGEYLSRQDVMSSIRNNLGLVKDFEPVRDKRAGGIASLMVDVRKSYPEPLTSQMLFRWHELVMCGNRFVKAGAWRDHSEPMQVISGHLGKETVHFEAPPSSRISEEMGRFIEWFNASAPGGQQEIKKAPIRSAIAHIYFESLHPFEDGNGRVGRAISEKALSQGAGRPILLSLSRTIEAHKRDYYDALKSAQTSNDITMWIHYFVNVILQAQTEAEQQVNFTLLKAKFFDRHKNHINERQLIVIRRMLEEGVEGFEGGINARKYIAITHVSKATATRDLQDMEQKGILESLGSGRNTRYQIAL